MSEMWEIPMLRVAAVLFLAAATASAQSIAALIDAAGNGDDAARLLALDAIARHPDASEAVVADSHRLMAEFQRYAADPNLGYFSRAMADGGLWDFGVAEDSPLFPLTGLYQGRMLAWVTLQYGGYWSRPEARAERYGLVRPHFQAYSARFPENRIARMYLGEPIPAPAGYPADPAAPTWANAQREGLERLADVIHWWIEHRQREDGQYGGGWGDDCEMWRFWTPYLIGFEDPVINAAQAKFSKAILSQPHMAEGYTDRVYDVEHTAEDLADALTPMMHLEPANPDWTRRALRLHELMQSLWMGTNERGHLQFKSTYFSVDDIDLAPNRACDTVYHARAAQPLLLYWQRTGDPELTIHFRKWMAAWADATARAERGKPAGIMPSAIHWPDGRIGGVGERWWDPENHDRDPLYVWPSAMSMMVDTMLQTHIATGDDAYLEPIRSMAAIYAAHLDGAHGEAEPGNLAWCAPRLALIMPSLAKYTLLTGADEFVPLIERAGGAYARARLSGAFVPIEEALIDNAASLRINFEGYTSEVRYTDRVLRFPAMYGGEGPRLAEPAAPIGTPDPSLLYSTATGDPGSALYFPANAVRWKTPPRRIAALVTQATRDAFAAELFHFGDAPRAMAAEFFMLRPGRYTLALGDVTRTFSVDGASAVVAFSVPPKTLVTLTVSREESEAAAP